MSQIELLIQLKDQLIIFFDELIEQFPREPDLVIVRIFLKDKIPVSDVMNYIVVKLLPLKPMVDAKDDDFFLQHNILFERLDDKKVNHFKRLWLSGSLDAEDKHTIWRWFKSFLYLAEKYVANVQVHKTK